MSCSCWRSDRELLISAQYLPSPSLYTCLLFLRRMLDQGMIIPQPEALRKYRIPPQLLASLIAQLVKNLPAMQETLVPIPALGRSAGEGMGYPLQCSWAFLVPQLVNNLPTMWETGVGKIPWRRERLPTPVFWPGEFHGLYRPWGRRVGHD